MSDLKELLERVKNATGPDRALDGDIAEAVGLFVGGHWRGGTWIQIAWFRELYAGPWELLQPYTASLDAIVALIEAKLPGELARLMDEALSILIQEAMAADEEGRDYRSAPQRLVLALNAAFLSALTKENAHGK